FDAAAGLEVVADAFELSSAPQAAVTNANASATTTVVATTFRIVAVRLTSSSQRTQESLDRQRLLPAPLRDHAVEPVGGTCPFHGGEHRLQPLQLLGDQRVMRPTGAREQRELHQEVAA